MQLNIKSASLFIKPNSPDYISLDTNLPNPYLPYDGTLSVDFRVDKGRGEDFLAQHFPGVPVTITDTTKR